MRMLSNLAVIFILAVLVLVFIPWALMYLFWLLGAAFWFWMLIDCVTRKFKKNTTKVIWVLVIVFGNIVGALVYFFFVKWGSK